MSTPVENSRAASRTWLVPAATVLLLTVLLALLVGLNMRRELNHDEHQFIASAALMARDGLVPYRDFAYFHVPAQSYLYALLYRLFDSLLLSSRLINILFGWGAVCLIFVVARRRFAADEHAHGPWAAWRYAALAALWMAALPLFTYTSGRAWNHDLPIFLLLAATLLHARTIIDHRLPLWFLLTGAMMGLAAATRLSFGVIALPFVLILWLVPGDSWRRRLGNTVAFGVGGLVGGLPVLIDLLRAPDSFIFGNLTYVRLNTLFYTSQGGTDAMSLPGKLSYLGEQFALAPAALLTLVAVLVGLWPLWKRLFRFGSGGDRELDPLRLRVGFLLLLALFSMISALAATPPQPQYFYPLFPIALLLIVELFVAWPRLLRPGGYYVYALAGMTSILLAAAAYAPGAAMLLQPGEWFPAKTHSYGRFIAALTAGETATSDRVLTLAPLYPLEGGVPIYPEFATGPFAWRVSPLVDQLDRQRVHIVSPDDLDELLAAEPPRAILTNVENDDADEEALFVAYAEENIYVPVTLPDESVLWLAPQARWGDAIQLGGRLLPAEPLMPGDEFLVDLYLQNLTPLESNYNRLIRITDRDGTELLRADGWPFGSPTSRWNPGEVWVDGQAFNVPLEAAPGYYRIDVSFYDPATLDDLGAPVTVGYLLVDDDGEADPAAADLSVSVGDAIVLRQATAELREPAAEDGGTNGGAVVVNLTWEPVAPVDQDYRYFVHVLDEQGALIAQRDGVPLDGFLPTSAWRSDTRIADQIEVPLPADGPAGTVTVIVGLYDFETLARLPVTWGEGQRGDAYVIGEIE